MEKHISIVILKNSEVFFDDNLKNILYGIEEEGIPFVVEDRKEMDSDVLGNEASQISKLDVGIGIGINSITLYHEKLEFGKALFKLTLKEKRERYRALGINSARLIKGVYFKLDGWEVNG
ncbi:glycerol dehydratase reactivase beta/small subunit family protein [Cetobacterium sp.]|uniref:glycerol dehydratase reactivase beta/small subunit family protein n=1 Tax=Cetobacterium sp. TaxID=2071632 RepID=UPI003AEFB1CD